MGISIDKLSQRSLIYGSLMAMLIGLFVSRALLSISMIVFIAFACLHRGFLQQLKAFIRQPLLVGIALLFVIPLVSGLWSEDKKEWAAMLQIKLPLLLLPLSFAGSWQLSHRQWKRVSLVFIVLLIGGCAWSLVQYITNSSEMTEAYLRAKVIPTPLENDHVRYSLLVCIGIINCVLLGWLYAEKKLRTFLGASALFFALYLHLIAARTGLLGFYIFLALLALVLLRKAALKQLPLVLLVLIGMPVAAWFLLPTFRNRIYYNLYDLSYITRNEYLPGANDGNRTLSIKAGWSLLQQHPWGLGTGDIKGETMKWYGQHLPGMLQTDKLYPSSEWLVYGNTAGWAGVVLFTLIMLLPLFYFPERGRFFWITLNIIAAASFLFDIGLEVQFGVFLYAFIVLWWWKWLNKESVPDSTL